MHYLDILNFSEISIQFILSVSYVNGQKNVLHIKPAIYSYTYRVMSKNCAVGHQVKILNISQHGTETNVTRGKNDARDKKNFSISHSISQSYQQE